MKHLINFLFLNLIAFNSFGQQARFSIAWSEKMNGSEIIKSYGNQYNYIGKYQDLLVFHKPEEKQTILEARNSSDMKLNNNFLIKTSFPKNEGYLTACVAGENINVYSQTEVKDSLSLFVNQYSVKGVLLKRIKLSSLNKKKTDGFYIIFHRSVNPVAAFSNLLVLAKEQDAKTKTSRLLMYYFDSTFLNPVKMEVSSKYEKNQLKFEEFLREGAILIRDQESYSAEYKNISNLHIVDFRTKAVNTIPLDFAGQIYLFKSGTITDDSHQFAGSFSDKNATKEDRDTEQSVFRFMLDKDDKIKELNVQKIPLEKIESETKKKLLTGLNGNFITSLEFDSTESFYFLAESKFSREGFRDARKSYHASLVHFGTEDIFQFKANGGLMRHVQLTKDQYTIIGQEVIGSLKPILGNKKLYVLFNDSPDNADSSFVHPASATFGIHFFVLEIEKDGTFKRFKITDESEKEVRLVLYPSYTIELSKSEYLFYVLEKSRDVKVGKITFK